MNKIASFPASGVIRFFKSPRASRSSSVNSTHPVRWASTDVTPPARAAWKVLQPLPTLRWTTQIRVMTRSYWGRTPIRWRIYLTAIWLRGVTSPTRTILVVFSRRASPRISCSQDTWIGDSISKKRSSTRPTKSLKSSSEMKLIMMNLWAWALTVTHRKIILTRLKYTKTFMASKMQCNSWKNVKSSNKSSSKKSSWTRKTKATCYPKWSEASKPISWNYDKSRIANSKRIWIWVS